MALDPADRTAVARQLGRTPRGARHVAHRCSCGLPDVVETSPRLSDGEPFPTLYYLTCPRARSMVSRLESNGLMREQNDRLQHDEELAARYRAAHHDYISRRDAIERLPMAASAGGMPYRVKCLHALVAHELAVPGINPFGAQALEQLSDWGAEGPCVQ